MATPAVAGARVWRYLDESRRNGVEYVVLYWPSILLSHLPPAAERAFTLSALPTVLMYFAGYLAVFRLAGDAWTTLRAARVRRAGT